MITTIGLDLGTRTGFAVLTPAKRPIKTGTWDLGAKAIRPVRYRLLSDNLRALAETYDKARFAVELPGARKQSTPAKRLLWGLLGVVELVLVGELGFELVDVNETSVKVVLGGHGRASKDEQIGAVNRRWGKLVDEHQADAIGVALASMEDDS